MAFLKQNHARIGELLGYPRTAAEAFDRGRKEDAMGKYLILEEKNWWESLSEEERKNLLEEGVLNFLTFKLSRENWRQELETVRRWQEVIKEKAPRIYQEITISDFWGSKVKKWEEDKKIRAIIL